jgi:hypothetical protein
MLRLPYEIKNKIGLATGATLGKKSITGVQIRSNWTYTTCRIMGRKSVKEKSQFELHI